MKKILLAVIISMTCTSAIAESNEAINFLQKPIVNTNTLNISNKGPSIGTKCESMCNSQFQSCIFTGYPWHVCDQQRFLCLFGKDGCYGI